MKCIDCHYLCALNGEILPSQQRQELKRKSREAFTWLICDKSLIDITHKEPSVFEQVSENRKCAHYRKHNSMLEPRPSKRRRIQLIHSWPKMNLHVQGLALLLCLTVLSLLFLLPARQVQTESATVLNVAIPTHPYLLVD